MDCLLLLNVFGLDFVLYSLQLIALITFTFLSPFTQVKHIIFMYFTLFYSLYINLIYFLAAVHSPGGCFVQRVDCASGQSSAHIQETHIHAGIVLSAEGRIHDNRVEGLVPLAARQFEYIGADAVHVWQLHVQHVLPKDIHSRIV